MLTTRSWSDPAPVARRLAGAVARRIRRVGREALVPEPAITRVDVVVFPGDRLSGGSAPAETTAASIERARGRIASVEVTVRSPPVERPTIAPDVLWLFVLDGAELEPDALSSFVDLFDAGPDLDVAYGDAASRGPAGTADMNVAANEGPWLLPGFSPERLADQFYLGHVVAIRPHRFELPDLPDVVDGPWPLVAAARTVAHVPRPLHRPAPDTGFWEPRELVDAEPPPVTAEDDLPPVSVVIPTNGSTRTLDRGPVRLVDQAVRSVLGCSYPDIEVVIVVTPGSPDELAADLYDLGVADGRHRRRVTVVADDRPFNFSNACNRGAVGSTGEILVFLNDDTQVIAQDWLEHLVGHARRPDVGAVGARLLFEDGRVQHSGIWSRGGHPTHRYEGWSGCASGYLDALRVAQNCLAVTGACLAVERSKFDLVGGFSPVFPNSYNDVDLCLKLWDLGYRTVLEPRAELHHFEASTRDPSITDDDLTALHDRWRWRLNHDPFDNPNHTAELSEEWPIPTAFPRGGDRPQPRFWPLGPLSADSTR